jgi:hypothetical protein
VAYREKDPARSGEEQRPVSSTFVTSRYRP